MLYKKYHRNFVKQFKVGVGVEWRSIINSNRILEVTTKPIIALNSATKGFYVYVILGTAENESLPLVFSSGRLTYYGVKVL